MTIVCPKCSTQLEVSGAPARPFTIRCPKCSTTVNVGGSASPASEKSGLAVGQSPSTERPRFTGSRPAPLFQPDPVSKPETASPTKLDDVSRLLAGLMSQSEKAGPRDPQQRPAWNPRKVLICTTEQHREVVARQLTKNSYQVFVAQDTGQAVDRMRENQLDVVVLDPEFDTGEQGAAFVMREVNVLRPPQRRRLFFVLLSPVQRTMDAHAAFLNNVNAVVNFRELEDLPNILEHALREYNELYKELNLAFNMPMI